MMKDLSVFLTEQEAEYVYFTVSYDNKDTDLKQVVRFRSGSEPTSKQMKAWVESKGATFKSFRKLKYDPTKHFMVYEPSQQTLNEIYKFKK